MNIEKPKYISADSGWNLHKDSRHWRSGRVIRMVDQKGACCMSRMSCMSCMSCINIVDFISKTPNRKKVLKLKMIIFYKKGNAYETGD